MARKHRSLNIGNLEVADPAAKAGLATSLTCDGGDSKSDAAAPVAVPPGVVPVPVVVFPNIRAPIKFGSVQSKFPLALMCGSISALI